MHDESSAAGAFEFILIPQDFCPTALLPVLKLQQQALVILQGAQLCQLN